MRKFCADVGRQLLVNYVRHMVDHKGWDWVHWNATKLDKGATGYHGLALTHAFAHSVPKATLPLLWFGGRVKYGGREIVWHPLFANA